MNRRVHKAEGRKALSGALMALAAIVFSCSVGPDYHRPAVDAPTAYRRAVVFGSELIDGGSFDELYRRVD